MTVISLSDVFKAFKQSPAITYYPFIILYNLCLIHFFKSNVIIKLLNFYVLQDHTELR